MPETTVDAGHVVWLAWLPEALPGHARPAGPEALDELTRRFFPCSLQRWLLDLLDSPADPQHDAPRRAPGRP